MTNLDFGTDWGNAAAYNFKNGHYILGVIQEINVMAEVVIDFAAAYCGASLLSEVLNGIGATFGSLRNTFVSNFRNKENISTTNVSNTWVRVDTIENIEKYGTNLGKDGQLFLTKPEALSSVNLSKLSGIQQAETILGLHKGDLSKSNILVKTTIDTTNLSIRQPTFGTDLFIPGGFTSGGAQEIVIDSINIFQNNAVQSIEFIKNTGK